MILPEYFDGESSPSQIENLRHLESFAPHWFWWGPPGTVGKLRKQPQSPGGGAARVNDATTAATLDKAMAAMRREGGGGVGLLVSAAKPGLVGVDLDNVIKDGMIHPLGLEAVERFKGAYVEISPSKTGLRIFCLGEVPADTPKGSTAVGDGIKFEAYTSGGAGRYLRTTGMLIEGTAGVVAHCPEGIEWLCSVMKAAKSSTSASIENRVGKGAPGASNMTLDAVFDALAGLRPDKDGGEVVDAIKAAVSAQPRSKLAEAWKGNLKPWAGDHSTADMFMCCEAIRRGAGHLENVASVWGKSGLSSREKFTRKDYRLSTIDRAARSVLADLEAKADKGGRTAPAVELPTELAESLALTGDRVTRSKSGRLEPTTGNVTMLFRNDPRLRGLLAFNELAQCAVRLRSWVVFDRGGCDRAGPLSDDDATRVSMWLAVEFGMKMDHKELMRGIEAAALDAKFDPLADRLQELGKAWDGVRRVDSWLVNYARIDATGCAEYVQAVGRCFLVGAVARALSPGCQLDSVLSVEGSGGAGKSSLFKALADAVASNLFADGVQDVSNPVALIEGTSGRWIVELAELAGIRRAADVEALKASITRREDSHRRPYDVMPRTIPRRFIFVATTNRTEGYLADSSGALARRFHPVRTTATETDPIDRAALALIAGQLWGEAVRMYGAGVKWHLEESDGAAFQQWTAGRELRREDGAFQDELFDYLQQWVAEDPAGGRSLRDIAKAVGDTKTSESGGTGAAAMQLAGTLTMSGMEKRKSGTSKWYFTAPAANRFAALNGKAIREQVGNGQKKGLKVV